VRHCSSDHADTNATTSVRAQLVANAAHAAEGHAMNRLTLSLWVFLATATITGGLLGRYLAAMYTGHGTTASLALTPVLVAAFAFSATVLVRIVRATSRSRAVSIAACDPEER